MKKDKICISKAVALMIPVTLVLIAVILFTNYINKQTYSTHSKAAAPASSATALCTYQGLRVHASNPGTDDRPFNYFYDPSTFCVLGVYSDINPTVRQPLPYKCNTVLASCDLNDSCLMYLVGIKALCLCVFCASNKVAKVLLAE